MKFVTLGISVAALTLSPAFAQPQGGGEIHMPDINIEGHVPEGPNHAGGAEKGGPDGGNAGSGGNSSASQGGNIPVTFQPVDNGTPPLPPPGYQTHKVQYANGSYDIVSLKDGGSNYTIDRHSPNGVRVGGESGSVAGYPNKGGQMFFAPQPVWRCYTPMGPILVNNPMIPGQPCMAITPMGTFYGNAGV